MSECTHNCGTCKESCTDKKSLLEACNELSKIKKVIAIVSGKGGVGKSLVTGLMATMTARLGKKVAILDADITGPSIPKMFGISQKAEGSDFGIYPASSSSGIKIISSNMFLENDSDPVLWRGPMIASMVKKFWKEVVWGDIDFMFVDMPPGTGDVPLTVFQSIKVDGIIVVTTPQELVSMIVEKAVKMANMMNVPIIGVVENMSYVKCPNCNERIQIFGESKANEVAIRCGLKCLAQMPLDAQIAYLVDQGEIEDVKTDCVDNVVAEVVK